METEILIDKLKQKAYKEYCSEMKKYRDEDNIIKFHLWQALKERMKRFFKGCNIYGAANLEDNTLSLFLNKKYNIAKDYMLFLEANEPLISLVCGGSEFKFKHDRNMKSYDYIYPKFKIYVYYGNGNCELKKIGEKTKTIKEPIYEVVCK